MDCCSARRGRSGTEGQRRSVRRPGGVPVTRLPALSIGHLLEGTAIEGHHVDPGRVSLAHSGKCNLLPIRRPVRMLPAYWEWLLLGCSLPPCRLTARIYWVGVRSSRRTSSDRCARNRSP